MKKLMLLSAIVLAAMMQLNAASDENNSVPSHAVLDAQTELIALIGELITQQCGAIEHRIERFKADVQALDTKCDNDQHVSLSELLRVDAQARQLQATLKSICGEDCLDGVEDEYESEVAPLRAQWAAHKELYLIPDADAEADHSALLLAQQIQTATKKVFSLTQDQSVQELLNNEK